MKEEDCLGGGILGEEAVGLRAGTAQGRPRRRLRPWEGGENERGHPGGWGGGLGALWVTLKVEPLKRPVCWLCPPA